MTTTIGDVFTEGFIELTAKTAVVAWLQGVVGEGHTHEGWDCYACSAADLLDLFDETERI